MIFFENWSEKIIRLAKIFGISWTRDAITNSNGTISHNSRHSLSFLFWPKDVETEMISKWGETTHSKVKATNNVGDEC